MFRIRVCAAMFVAALFWPVASIAQTPPDAGDLSALNLEQLMKVQFYTASKHAEDISATPASVTVITRTEIQTYGYRTLAEILQAVRGFWINSDRNYSYVGLRGFARPGDYNTRILLLVNGHRLNDNIFYQALLGTEFPLDVDLIERVEIVRGPASSLYGTNAFLGVVNVVTRQPSIAPAVEASVESGSNFTRKARLTIDVPKLFDGAFFSATVYRSDGAGNLFFPEFDNPATNRGLAHRIDGDRQESAFALVRRKNWTVQAMLGSREKLIPTGSFDTIFGDAANRTIDTRGYLEGRYQRDFVSGLQLTSRWFYDIYSYRGTYAYDLDGIRTLSFDGARGDWIGSELNASIPLGHRHRLTAGTDIRYNIRQDQTNRWQSLAVPVLDDHRRSTVVAFYVQDELTLTSRLTVNAGIRIDHYTTFGTAVSPRVAVVFRPDSKTSIKYSYGHAFRGPNAYELYYTDGVSQVPNPRLNPETIDSHNIGLERALSPNLHAIAEIFYSRLNGLIDFDAPDPITGMSQYINVGAATAKGVEFQVNAQHRGFRGELSYILQQSNSISPSAEPNLPRHIAKLRLEVPLRSFATAGLGIQFLGPQDAYSDVRIASSLRSDVNVSVRPVYGFRFSAACFNLFDRHNYFPGSPALRQSRLLDNGREFRLKLVWSSSH